MTLNQDLHNWLMAVLRSRPTHTDVDDCLDLLGRLDRNDKRDFWRWLSQNDPNLKQWLKLQGQQRGAA